MGNPIQLNQDDMELIQDCEYYPNGEIKEKYIIRVADKVKHGRVIRYYEVEDEDDLPNTIREQGNYSNDKEEGFWAGFWRGGELAAVGQMRMGKRNGLWLFYDESGEFERWEIYDWLNKADTITGSADFDDWFKNNEVLAGSTDFNDYVHYMSEEWYVEPNENEDNEECWQRAHLDALDDIQMHMKRITRRNDIVSFNDLIRGIEQFF